LLASTALTTSTTLLTGAAWAADMPLKAPPKPAPVPFTWGGCYVGVNAGGAFTTIDQSIAIPGIFTIDNGGHQTSFTGGGQIGCNWQADPHWVLGIEGDIDYLHASRTNNFAVHTSLFSGEEFVGSQQTTVHWLGTARASLGYVWDRMLYYVTGGLAFGEVDSSATVILTSRTSNPIFAGSESATRVGWTAGGGVKYAITDRVSGKLEYLYFDLGNASYNLTQVSGVVIGGSFPTAFVAAIRLPLWCARSILLLLCENRRTDRPGV
jgi:outer membrane immunogenic protein